MHYIVMHQGVYVHKALCISFSVHGSDHGPCVTFVIAPYGAFFENTLGRFKLFIAPNGIQ